MGFFANIILSKIFGEEKINETMKKIGIGILFIFIPVLQFKLFLNVDFGSEEINFAFIAFANMAFLYLIAYIFAVKKAEKNLPEKEKNYYLKTVIVNQGRSAAFVGGAILAIEEWAIYAAIYIGLLGIFLFAIVPYVLSSIHKREVMASKKEKNPLPFFLRIYPWYLLLFPVSAVIVHKYTGITTSSYDWGIILNFFASLTIPIALYYVGSSIKIKDIKIDELKKLFYGEGGGHGKWVRDILILTMVITPVIISLLFGLLLFLKIIPSEWFVVMVLNSILPITSTNMFLIPYGIDKKVTALSVTWTTIFAIPVFVILIEILSSIFI